MPHLRHRVMQEPEPAGMPPKGFLAVRVGGQGEQQQRFFMPVAYLAHPLFAELLEAAAAEYGYSREGAIAIPCGIEQFHGVHDIIRQERDGDPAGGQHGQHHHHYRLPRLADCFRA